MNAILLFIVMLGLIMLGVPIAFSMGISTAIFIILDATKDLILIPQRIFVGMDSFILLAIPLFTFSGYLMEKAGLSKRLVEWANALFGHFPGAMGTVAIISCAVFAALTGSGPATVASIGSIMIPMMINTGYKRKDACGLVAAGGALGPIIPPSIPMIIYGSTMNVSVPAMFKGGVLPGLFLAFLMIIVNTRHAIKNNIQYNTEKINRKEAAILTLKALPVLLLPVIVLGGIYGGIFTATEAAAVSVLCSLILGLAFKTLSPKNLYESCYKTIITSGMIMLLIGVSAVFAWIMAYAKIPAMVSAALIPYMQNQYIFIAVLLIILFIVGCIMDAAPSITILAPILSPIGIQLGMDPVHLGVVFVISLVIGYLTPPFGLNLFTACSVGEESFANVVKGSLPYTIVLMIGVIIIALIPGFVTLVL